MQLLGQPVKLFKRIPRQIADSDIQPVRLLKLCRETLCDGLLTVLCSERKNV